MEDIKNRIKKSLSNIFSQEHRSFFLAIFLSLILFFLDFPFSGLSFNGIDYTKISINFGFLRIIISFLIIFFIIYLIFYFSQKGQLSEDNKYYLILAGEIAIFFVLGLPFSIGAILHIVLGYLIISSIEPKEDLLKTIIFMYALDFAIYPLLESLIIPLNGLRLAAHPYLLFVLLNTAKYAESSFLKFSSTFVIIFFVFMLFANFGLKLSLMNVIGQTNIEDLKDASLIYKKTFDFFKEVGNSISISFQGFGQLFNISQYTYTGQEQQTENPQGVFLKEIKTGDYVYWEDLPIYVTSILEARKIDKPFDVKVQCYTEKINDIGKKEIIFGNINQIGQKEKEFNIINGAETTIQCIFEKNTLTYGNYQIIFNVSFEFSTSATKKIYLMDRERMLKDYQLLSNKGETPSKEGILNLYKIKDANQPSIYTTGPVSLVIGTENSPWDIGDENINPRFGITIKNLWEEGGKLSKLKTIYLKIPENFNILENTCTGISVESVSQTNEEKEKFFKKYKIPVSDIGNIENDLTFICLMEIDKNSLDNTPITTRYLKSEIVYDYELIEKVNINIEKREQIAIEDSFETN